MPYRVKFTHKETGAENYWPGEGEPPWEGTMRAAEAIIEAHRPFMENRLVFPDGYPCEVEAIWLNGRNRR